MDKERTKLDVLDNNKCTVHHKMEKNALAFKNDRKDWLAIEPLHSLCNSTAKQQQWSWQLWLKCGENY